jgi:major capsid protein E
MPEISLLEPLVLLGVVEKLPSPQNMILLNGTPKRQVPTQTVTWDIIRGSRMMAKPNVPNSEAHIVGRLGREQASASLLYVREKKVFEPTTLMWLREVGTVNGLQNAEREVVRELADLNNRIDAFVEYTLWKALGGNLVLDFPDVQANIDYKFPADHKVTAAVSWATATPTQIVDNVTAWKKLVLNHGRVAANKAYATQATLDRIVHSFVANGTTPGYLLSDRMRDQYYNSGTIPGFLGMDWVPVEHVYEDDQGNEIGYLADDTLLIGNFDDNRPVELLEGPTADFSAPNNFIGRYTKSWQEPDPSGRQVLIEYNFLPVVTRPEQFVIADLVP